MQSPFHPPVTRGQLRGTFSAPYRGKSVPRSAFAAKRIGDKDVGTAQTIEVMRELAISGSVHPGIRIAAERATEAVRGHKNYEAELEAIFDFVKGGTRYTLDPRWAEYVQHPAWSLFVSRRVDCDDAAVLLAALAMSLGHEAAFRTIRADPYRPDEFSHVYAILGHTDASGTHWHAADPTVAMADFGWEAPPESRIGIVDWPVSAAPTPVARPGALAPVTELLGLGRLWGLVA